MNYEEFKEAMLEKIVDFLPEEMQGLEAKITSCNKINRELEGIIFVDPSAERVVSPVIYIDPWYERYEQGFTLEDALRGAGLTAARAFKDRPELGSIKDTINTNHIVFQLVNTEQNEVYLQDVPHREFQDLSIIYRTLVNMELDGMESIVVNNKLMEHLGLDEEQLYQMAKENTPRLLPIQVAPMKEVLRRYMEGSGIEDEILDEILDDTDVPLWVVGNERGLYGATTLLDEEAIHALAENLGSDLYILPSSIHEVLATPVESGIDEEELAMMVEEVNFTQVDLEDRLSNQVYYYDRAQRELTLASDAPVKRLDGADLPEL